MSTSHETPNPNISPRRFTRRTFLERASKLLATALLATQLPHPDSIGPINAGPIVTTPAPKEPKRNPEILTFAKETELATFTKEDRTYTVRMKVGGSEENPTKAISPWGPEFSDFTMTVDTQIKDGSADPRDNGYQLNFRSKFDEQGNFISGYYLMVENSGSFRLSKLDKDSDPVSTDWLKQNREYSPNKVHRTVITVEGERILINFDGIDYFDVKDDSFSSGYNAFGAIAWAKNPVTAEFKDVLVTTPTQG